MIFADLYGNRELGRRKSRTITPEYGALPDLMDELLGMLVSNDGTHISAPMAGIFLRVIVVRTGKDVLEVANPVLEVKIRTGEFVPWGLRGVVPEFMPGEYVESCLSLRNGKAFIGVGVVRPQVVRLRGIDRHRAPLERVLHGPVSVAVQHQMDHLNGVTLLDHCGPKKRAFIERVLERARSKT